MINEILIKNAFNDHKNDQIILSVQMIKGEIGKGDFIYSKSDNKRFEILNVDEEKFDDNNSLLVSISKKETVDVKIYKWFGKTFQVVN